MPCLLDTIFVRKMTETVRRWRFQIAWKPSFRACSSLLFATFSVTRKATIKRQSEMMKQEKSLKSTIFLRVHQREFSRPPKGKQHRCTNIFKSTPNKRTSTKQYFHVFPKENYICCVNKVIIYTKKGQHEVVASFLSATRPLLNLTKCKITTIVVFRRQSY